MLNIIGLQGNTIDDQINDEPNLNMNRNSVKINLNGFL